MQNWLTKLFRDKNGHIVLWQTPNPPLIGFIACWLAASVLKSHPALHSGLLYLGYACLFTWAYLEITSGSTWFRRILGGGILVLAISLLVR